MNENAVKRPRPSKRDELIVLRFSMHMSVNMVLQGTIPYVANIKAARSTIISHYSHANPTNPSELTTET